MSGYDYGGGPGGDRGYAFPSGGDGHNRLEQEHQTGLGPNSRTAVYPSGQNGRPPPSPVLGSGDNTDTESRRSMERNRSRPRGEKPANAQVHTCHVCGGVLQGQYVRALEATFHLDCFTCRVSLFPSLCHDAVASSPSLLTMLSFAYRIAVRM